MKSKHSIYLDHAAGTPINQHVLEKMWSYFGEQYGNPSSLYTSGRLAKRTLEETRRAIASSLACLPEEIIFTGSGTEGDNLAIIGIAHAYKTYGNHILVSSVEHKAVLESAKQLEREGFVVEYIPVDRYGMVDVADVMKRVTKNTILISVMYANNEIGTIQPIKELAQAVRTYRGGKSFPVLHTDACQAPSYLPVDVTELGVDAMTLNSSKVYGPRGVGLLYIKNHVHIEPVIRGGGQERGYRSGTESLPLIVGFGEALMRVIARRNDEVIRVEKLREVMIENLYTAIPGIVLNGHPNKRLPNNIHIAVPYIEGESIVLHLDEMGIAVSTGSACSSSLLQVSHVLTAINQDKNLMHGSVRITLGEETTQADCEYCVEALATVVARLRRVSPLTLTSWTRTK